MPASTGDRDDADPHQPRIRRWRKGSAQIYQRWGQFPPIRWTGAPDGVRSYMLLVEDPDAPNGTFRHCAIANIPADAGELPQSVDTSPDWPSLQYARNDFGNAGYDGPEPPKGHGVHHYHFKLAALDVPRLGVPKQAGIDRLWQEARKHGRRPSVDDRGTDIAPRR